MANPKKSNDRIVPSDQSSSKNERLFDPNAPLRFAARNPNMATNGTNNQDRRAVEQWQLDSTNAYVEKIAAHLLSCQEEVFSVAKNHIDLIDTVQDAVGDRVITKKAVRGRSLTRKIMSFFFLIIKAFLLLSVFMALVLVVFYLYENYEGDFFDLFDIDYPHYF